MPKSKYTKEQMAMLAGAYAIRNKGRHLGASYCVFDRTENGITNFQEISFEDAMLLLVNMAESEVKEDAEVH